MIPKPADIVFVIKPKNRKEPWLANAIRWITRSYGEPQTETAHTAGIGVKKNLIEMKHKGIETPWKEWAKETSDFEVWRYYGPEIDAQIRHDIGQCFETYIGRWYGVQKYPFYLADHLIGKVLTRDGRAPNIFRRLLFVKILPVCSCPGPVCYAPYKIRLASVSALAQTPDCQRDYFMESNDWQLIFKKEAGQVCLDKL